MKLLHFHLLLAGIVALMTAQARSGPPPAGRVVYRFNETVTLTKCDSPDLAAKNTTYTRKGYLLLDSQVSAEDWVRVLSEVEAEGTNASLPLVRSEMGAVEQPRFRRRPGFSKDRSLDNSARTQLTTRKSVPLQLVPFNLSPFSLPLFLFHLEEP